MSGFKKKLPKCAIQNRIMLIKQMESQNILFWMPIKSHNQNLKIYQKLMYLMKQNRNKVTVHLLDENCLGFVIDQSLQFANIHK
jgi:hypothetical protein